LTPGAELRISVVGPLTSLGLAAVFWAVTATVGPGPSLLAVTTGWLGWFNAMLAVFNLVPAFPLDGGRVLRALLWRRSGDKIAATVRAGRMGEDFGWALAAAGVFELLVAGWLGGAWLVFIGWYLRGAAKVEAAPSVDAGLHALKAADVMVPAGVLAGAEMSVERFVDEGATPGMVDGRFLPVADRSGRLVGLVSVLSLAMVPSADRSTVTVGSLAVPVSRVVVCRPDDDLAEVAARLRSTPGLPAVVVRTGVVVGMISESDLDRGRDLAVSAR
jgi:CBS domain-containing protein